ncbi:MAG: ATP-dependent zinc protease family protein [Gammaproteobacteria bacterium]
MAIRHRTARARRQLCAALLLLACATPATAVVPVLGWLEWAHLGADGPRLKAKLDTGARTSSIDAAAIETFDRDGEQWVRFRIPFAARPEDSDHVGDLVLERRLEGSIRVKDHQRPSETRYVVSLDLCLGSRHFATPVTLTDRSRFNYPLLLGRRALKERFLVDPAATFTTGKSCQPPPAP